MEQMPLKDAIISMWPVFIQMTPIALTWSQADSIFLSPLFGDNFGFEKITAPESLKNGSTTNFYHS